MEINLNSTKAHQVSSKISTSYGNASSESHAFSLDFQNLKTLESKAKSENSMHDEKLIKQVANQLESVLMHMLMKSMRDATPDGGLFTDQAGKSYQSMFDQEITQHLSGRGFGLAEHITKQIKAMQKNTIENPIQDTSDPKPFIFPNHNRKTD